MKLLKTVIGDVLDDLPSTTHPVVRVCRSVVIPLRYSDWRHNNGQRTRDPEDEDNNNGLENVYD